MMALVFIPSLDYDLTAQLPSTIIHSNMARPYTTSEIRVQMMFGIGYNYYGRVFRLSYFAVVILSGYF